MTIFLPIIGIIYIPGLRLIMVAASPERRALSKNEVVNKKSQQNSEQPPKIHGPSIFPHGSLVREAPSRRCSVGVQHPAYIGWSIEAIRWLFSCV